MSDAPAKKARAKVITQPANAGPNQEDGRAKTWFKPGQSGNPKGKPKGSKHKLGEAFLADMLAAWEAKGKGAIDRVIEDRPHEFIKAVASILPKDVNIKREAVEELTDDELAIALAALRSLSVIADAGEGSEKASRH